MNFNRRSNIFQYPYDGLFNPVLSVLHQLGGSATIDEMKDQIIKLLNLNESEVEDIHRGNITKLEYRLAWARTYLKNYGLLENSSRGVWALTAKGQKTTSVDKRVVKRYNIELTRRQRIEAESESSSSNDIDIELHWKERVLQQVRSLSPEAFERLSQRLLRELGFINVEVTGRTGDGGIDGKGIVKINGVLSFHMVFQCKKFSEKVGPAYIRDFRGAMDGRAEKGLFITTGQFTNSAEEEAVRPGATAIDLINGLELAERLKSLSLGVKTKLIEEIEIDIDWFSSILVFTLPCSIIHLDKSLNKVKVCNEFTRYLQSSC